MFHCKLYSGKAMHCYSHFILQSLDKSLFFLSDMTQTLLVWFWGQFGLLSQYLAFIMPLIFLQFCSFFFHFNGAHSNQCTQTTISFIFGKLCAATPKNLLWDRKNNRVGELGPCTLWASNPKPHNINPIPNHMHYH